MPSTLTDVTPIASSKQRQESFIIEIERQYKSGQVLRQNLDLIFPMATINLLASPSDEKTSNEDAKPRSKPNKFKKLINFLRLHSKFLIAFGVPLLLIWLPIIWPTQEAKCGFVLLIMLAYWLTECIPIAITGLIPVVLLPLFGIEESTFVAFNYMKDVGMLFICTSVMALLVEKTGLHRRVGIKILLVIGAEAGKLLFGVMLVVYFCSMWINNLAATAMMLPIVEAILEQLGGHYDPEKLLRTRKMLGLAVAYSASIGGTATLVGTITNPVLLQELIDEFGSSGDLSFGTWMAFAVPVSLVILLFSWMWIQIAFSSCSLNNLRKRVKSCRTSVDGEQENGSSRAATASLVSALNRQYKNLGRIRCEEALAFVFFLLLVLVWTTRDPGMHVSGWRALLGIEKGMISDVPAAGFLCILCFMIPVRRKKTADSDGRTVVKVESLLEWRDFEKACPWAMLLAIGGGFAISEGCNESGLGQLFTDKLEFLTSLSPEVVLFVLLLLASTLTEFTANVVVCAILLPLFSDLSVQMSVNPLFLLFPVTLACSFAFQLPVGSPPNALVHVKGFATTRDMLKCGMGMNVISLVCTFIFSITLGNAIFGWNSFPAWAIDVQASNLTHFFRKAKNETMA